MNRIWLPLLALPLLVFGVVAVYSVWLINSGSPGNVDFYWRRTRYESIAAKARAVALTPGTQTQTTVDGFKVDIQRLETGSYTLTITTLDLHHAGTYGYVFSDLPLTAHPNVHYPNFQEVDNPGDMPFADKRIIGQNGNWWSVYNNLN